MPCTLVAPELVKTISNSNIKPTFGFDDSNNQRFGFEATFTSTGKTCSYSVGTSFVPVFKTGALMVTCTLSLPKGPEAKTSILCPDLIDNQIPDGIHTLSYASVHPSCPPPETTTVLIGPTPTPVTESVYSTITSTTSSSAAYSQTVTSTAYRTTTTQTTTYLNLMYSTSTSTATYSSCTPSSKTSSASSSSSSSKSSGSSSSSGSSFTSPSSTPKSSSTPSTESSSSMSSSKTSTSGSSMPMSSSNTNTPTWSSSWGSSWSILTSSSSKSSTSSSSMPTSGSTTNMLSSSSSSSTSTSSSRSTSSSKSSTSSSSMSTSSSSTTNTPASSSLSSTATSSSTSSTSTSISTSNTPSSSSSPSMASSSSTSSMPTSMPTSSTSRASSTTSEPRATTTAPYVSCPAADQTTYNANGKTFLVECYSDRPGCELKTVPAPSFGDCITICANTPNCVDVSYLYDTGPCILRSALGNLQSSGTYFGARLVGTQPTCPATSASSSSTSTDATSPTTSSTISITTSSSTLTTTTSPPVIISTSTGIPTPSSTPTRCPDINGTLITTGRGVWVVECYIDRQNSDLGGVSAANFTDCVNTCSNNINCVDVSYVPGGPCYLKSDQGNPNPNSDVWGARLEQYKKPSTTATSAAPAPTDNRLSCPASNNTVYYSNMKIFRIQCGVDRSGGDLASGTPVYNVDFQTCVDTCANNTACVDLSHSGSACYLKGSTTTPQENGNVWAAQLIGTYDGMSTVTYVQSSTTQMAPAQPTASGLQCPGANGTAFTGTCGSTWQIECDLDRQDSDLGSQNAYTLDECMNICDATDKCMVVSYLKGSPGPCYLKSAANTPNYNGVWGARQITGCTQKQQDPSPTSNNRLKLHRKRVVRHVEKVHHVVEARAVGYAGPDYTFAGTVGSTTTTTIKTTTTVAVVYKPTGATTITVTSPTSTATTEVTSNSLKTITSTTTLTTCPTGGSRMTMTFGW
ncbi:hypothetical protein P154DRAFT_256589 [Amniculicola lignicola CBS 123094]|uniref:Apple domain-containing protein n=1 Tax=Amniculicola lignicola CBS 123094 TaxID=1392246 RepID=A0A6A5WWW0_9PLEO|nr:hypothetical protein P154DRAFT_256589 [Amniculicola lignicola CBS 123094]